jgi:hypothetical protein
LRSPHQSTATRTTGCPRPSSTTPGASSGSSASGNRQISGSGALGDYLAEIIRAGFGEQKVRVRADTFGYLQHGYLLGSFQVVGLVDGHILHRQDMALVDVLEGELESYPNGANDDCADLVAQAVVSFFGEKLAGLYPFGNGEPAEAADVAAQHPEVVKKMRDHYETWWGGVEPGLRTYAPISIGSRQENPARLCSSDWQDIYCDNPRSVLSGEGGPQGGPWNIFVERDGEYEIELRRWPAEIDLSLSASCPEKKMTAGSLPAAATTSSSRMLPPG